MIIIVIIIIIIIAINCLKGLFAPLKSDNDIFSLSLFLSLSLSLSSLFLSLTHTLTGNGDQLSACGGEGQSTKSRSLPV